jgi:hypothetical protein
VNGSLPYHCPEHQSDHLISPCVKQLARIAAMGKAGLIWLGPLEKCVACQGKKLIIREAPPPMSAAVAPPEKEEKMAGVVNFKNVEEAEKVLGPGKLTGMSGGVAESAAPAPINIQFCKNHPEVEAHKNKHGRYMGLCLECLRDRAARNSRNRAGKVPQGKQEDSPFNYAGPVAPDNHPDVRPLYAEGPSPTCKNHSDRPAKIDNLGRSMGLCSECLSARGRKAGLENTARGITAPPMSIPLNLAKYEDLKNWLITQAEENERTLQHEIIYRLKLAMREATDCG